MRVIIVSSPFTFPAVQCSQWQPLLLAAMGREHLSTCMGVG